MTEVLKKSIQKLGIAYAVVWAFIIASAILIFRVYRLEIDATTDLMETGVKLLIFINILFYVSILVALFGIWQAWNVRKILKTHNIAGGGVIVWGFFILLLCNIISGQSLYGGNIGFGLLLQDFFNNWPAVPGLLAMLGFTLFPIFTFVGINRIANGEPNKFCAFTGFKKVLKPSLFLLILCVVLSPALMSYFNANIEKFQNPTPINIIALVLYGVGIIFFIIKIFEAREGELINPNVIEPIPFVDNLPALKDSLSSLGKSYFYVWTMILVSALIMFFYYGSGWRFFMILTYIAFIAGWFTIIYGAINTFKFHNLLSKCNVKEGKWFFFSFLILACVAVLSFNSIFGANIFFEDGWLDYEELGESIRDMADSGELKGELMFLGVLALFVFTLFPIAILIGTIKLCKVFKSFRKSNIGSIILLCSAIIFSPFILTSLNSTEWDEFIWFNTLGLIAYAVGIYFLVKPMLEETKIREDLYHSFNAIEEGDRNIQYYSIKEYKKTLNDIGKGRKLYWLGIIACCSIGASIVFLIVEWPEQQNFSMNKEIQNEVKEIEEIENHIRNNKDNHSKIKESKGQKTDYAYINADRTKMYESASYSEVVTEYEEYQVVRIVPDEEAEGDWVICTATDVIQNIPFYSRGYILSSSLVSLFNYPIESKKFDNKNLKLETSLDSDKEGYLKIILKGDKFTAKYTIYSKASKQAGYETIIDSQEFEGNFNDGELAIFYNDTPVIYDKGKNLIMFNDYLWKVN